MSQIREAREMLVRKAEQVTGLTFKRANYGTTTGGLSVANKDMVANGLAHLLCNSKNFVTVNCLLDKWDEIKDGDFIHEDYNSKFDLASVLYACGTAPRIVSNVSRHKSKDAAIKGGIDAQGFIAWAQAWRIKFTETGYVGTSRSVKVSGANVASKPDKIVNGFNMSNFLRLSTLTAPVVEVVSEDKLAEIKSAQEFQRSMHELLSVGGLAVDRVLKGKSLTDLRGELAKRAAAAEARKVNKTEAPAVEKAAPAVKKGNKRGRGKGNAA